MQIDAVFVPHITDFWAPASVDGVLKPNVPFTCTLLDPCDEETIQTSTKVYYDKVAWDKLRRLPGHEGLPAFKDVATSLIPATNFTHDENNIADLESISEGHILHTIRSRYKKKSIYTNVGRVVVAMNPFQNMLNLINLQMIKTYSAAEEPYMLAPHIYQISAASFQGVSKHHKDQSILITGESGKKCSKTKLKN
jgi:myosin heavy subunit